MYRLFAGAVVIPVGVFLWAVVSILNPFGYRETAVLIAGSEGDLHGSLRLEPSPDLGPPVRTDSGLSYRTLHGTTLLTLDPSTTHSDGLVSVSVRGAGTYAIPPHIDDVFERFQWDWVWDFTNRSLPGELSASGTTFPFDQGQYFVGDGRVWFPETQDQFEEKPFLLFAEWTPHSNTRERQQIVGHFNWELLQNSDSVVFQVGRMGDEAGPFHSIRYPISGDFFGVSHTAVAAYVPGDPGFIQLYVDGVHAGRVYIGSQQIHAAYGSQDLSFGKSGHGNAEYFHGYIHRVAIAEIAGDPFAQQQFQFRSTQAGPVSIPLVAHAPAELYSVVVEVAKR
jgi:hypothetical protein